MLKIEKQIYNYKKWYKQLKPRFINPKMKGRPRIIGWLGFIFYNEKHLKEEQTTYVYCPRCHTELISTNSYYGQDEKGLEHFKCTICKTHSIWDFDTPTPVLIDKEEYPNQYYNPTWKEPKYDIDHSVIRYGGSRNENS